MAEVDLEPSSGVPPEYCEFLPKAEFRRALPWLVQNRDAGAHPPPPPPLPLLPLPPSPRSVPAASWERGPVGPASGSGPGQQPRGSGGRQSPAVPSPRPRLVA